MQTFLITNLIAFISTNLDNIFIVTLLFAQAKNKKDNQEIVIGQYVGTLVLLTISIFASYSLSLLNTDMIKYLGIIPIILGIKTWLDYKKENDNKKINKANTFVKNKNTAKNHNQLINAILLTIANGADNLGIYIPLFKDYTKPEYIIMIIIFIVMIAISCLIGYKLASFPIIKDKLEKSKHIIIPIVFILLGLYIIFK
ncbi:cadmium resistance transporter [Mycoplasma sp. P36-A1]|uniref:cadmium resistance transporter n=1 Tax=Mycoplasma sp. P36-A1 TaxID=3252900 RepID=UPI003C2DE185